MAELERLTPPAWLLQTYLQEDSLVMLYGAPNSFKSFIALDWALCIATGRPWLGARVPIPKRVIYVSAEGQRGIALRVGAWQRANAIPTSALERIRFITCPVALSDALQFQVLCEVLEAEAEAANDVTGASGGERETNGSGAPSLLIFDTLARCFGAGDENSTQDMNAFVAACDELRVRFPRCVVLVIHHSGKEEEKGARGSIALHGATDAIFKTSDRSGLQVTLSNPRSKDTDELPPRLLKLRTEGSSLVVEGSEEPPSAARESAGEAKARAERMALLGLIPPAGISYSGLFAGSGYLVARTFARALKRLGTEGLITQRDGLYHLAAGAAQAGVAQA